MDKQLIQFHLKDKYKKLNIEVLSVAASTNTLVCDQAVLGAKEGLVVVAEEQTAGRGRRGRSFFSPSGTGLYMSILLRPDDMPMAQATCFTTMAAVAMCEAIEEVCDKKPGIKWVNDIFIDGRKVCGILTEGFPDMKSGMLDYAVLGVGVNVFAPKEGFPDDITNSAQALLDTEVPELKERLAAAFLNHFLDYYYDRGAGKHISEYKRRSLAIGREVTVLSGKGSRQAVAYDVDETCRLLVRYEDGETEALSSGEISIKFI